MSTLYSLSALKYYFFAMTIYTPEILSSRVSFQRFLSGEEAVATIRPGPHNLAHRWDITDFEVKELCNWGATLFLTAVSYLLQIVCLTSLSNRVWVLSRHQLAEARFAKAAQVFQDNLITRSINTYREEDADFYLQDPSAISFNPEPLPVKFQQLGLCRGMCYWHMHLLFKTQLRFVDPVEHLRAVGDLFATGAPIQAALLHALPTNDFLYELSGLDVEEEHVSIPTKDKSDEALITELNRLDPGKYFIYTSNHVVTFIKMAGQQFIFDPTVGTINVSSPLLFQNAMSCYFDIHDREHEILIDRCMPRAR